MHGAIYFCFVQFLIYKKKNVREISTLQNNGNPRRFELVDNIYQGIRHLIARFVLSYVNTANFNLILS